MNTGHERSLDEFQAWAVDLDWGDVRRILELRAFAGISPAGVSYFEESARKINERLQRAERPYKRGGARPWSRRRALRDLAKKFAKENRHRQEFPSLADAFARICQTLAANERVGQRPGRRQGKTRFAERDYVDRAIGDLAPNHALTWLFAPGRGNKLSPGRQRILDRALDFASRDSVIMDRPVELDRARLAKEIRERAQMPNPKRGKWYWNARFILHPPNR